MWFGYESLITEFLHNCLYNRKINFTLFSTISFGYHSLYTPVNVRILLKIWYELYKGRNIIGLFCMYSNYCISTCFMDDITSFWSQQLSSKTILKKKADKGKKNKKKFVLMHCYFYIKIVAWSENCTTLKRSYNKILYYLSEIYSK